MWLTSTGNGSCPARPRGVALIATSTSTGPFATVASAPMPLAHFANAFARLVSRERTNKFTPRSAAATAVARADPPVPTTSQRSPLRAAPSLSNAAVTPATSVLSPTSVPSSAQNVLHAPTRAQTSVFRATDPSTASLCGTVTFPAPPVAACIARTAGSDSPETRIATYTASRPSARNAALCIAGESEWATGSPMTMSNRVLALISTLALGHEPVGDGSREGLELLAGVAVDAEVAAERVAHLVAAAARVFAQDEYLALPAQLVHARAMMAGHREDQVRAFDQLAREQAGAMPRQVEPALEPHEVGAFGGRRAVPGAGAGRGNRDLDAALLQGALEQRRGERAAADVSGADEEDVLDHGASRPTARRSSATLSVPSRTISARGLVQSTTVDGGRFPRTPPSSTRSCPDWTAGAKSRAIASAPGPGGWPGILADVDVSGEPSAATSCAIAWCDVQRTAIPPSGPRSMSGSRPDPPGSTSVSGPGQNARARASAEALNASPCASAIERSLINNRKGLLAERPFIAASAATSACTAREPSP